MSAHLSLHYLNYSSLIFIDRTEGIEYIDRDGEASSSLAEIHAFIKGPDETPYAGGRFHMKLILSDEYPNSPPRRFFLTKIYHPNVAANGDICVNTLKKDWVPDTTVLCI